jgi:transcriptional regulator with XRE-family HTH domain
VDKRGPFVVRKRNECKCNCELVLMPTVGDRIRAIREEMQMNQERLAERANLSKGFLSDVENNKRNISSENLLKIANVLGASVDFLLRGEVSETVSSEPVIIPPELSQVAEELELSYAATVELLEAHRSVIARRSNKGLRRFSVDDWKELHKAIKKVFG